MGAPVKLSAFKLKNGLMDCAIPSRNADKNKQIRKILGRESENKKLRSLIFLLQPNVHVLVYLIVFSYINDLRQQKAATECRELFQDITPSISILLLIYRDIAQAALNKRAVHLYHRAPCIRLAGGAG
ncbi:hypothetical protein RQN30_04450 [Arcanobacterium hippocoleae]